MGKKKEVITVEWLEEWCKYRKDFAQSMIDERGMSPYWIARVDLIDELLPASKKEALK